MNGRISKNPYSPPIGDLNENRTNSDADLPTFCQEPEVIYRTRSLSDAKGLVSHLIAHRFDARLAVENPMGYFGGLPVSDFVHEVMARNFDRELLTKTVMEWELLGSELKIAATEPYCYHCGVTVAVSAICCSACGGALEQI